MEPKKRYYQPSGAVDLNGVLKVFAYGLAGIIPMSFIYSYATFYIPLIYLNFLLAVFFGTGIGYLTNKGIKAGKIRNKAVAFTSRLALSLIAICCAWLVWLNIVGFGWLLNPVDVYHAMLLILENGLWSFEGSTPTGITLALFWLAEALIITVAAFKNTAKVVGHDPFCEKCHDWVETKSVIAPLNFLPKGNNLKKHLEAGNLTPLLDLKSLREDAPSYSEWHLAHCETCNGMYLLSGYNVHGWYNSEKQEMEEEVNPIVENLYIGQFDYQKLKDHRFVPSGVEGMIEELEQE